MKPSESLVSYHGRAQKLMKSLSGTTYNVPDTHKWGLLTNGLLEVYKWSVRIFNVTFVEQPYHEPMKKLQQLPREDVGDPFLPLDIQKRKSELKYAAQV